MSETFLCGVYGAPTVDLVEVPPGAVQLSPLVPGSARLEDFDGAFASIHMLGPPGTIERRYSLALALRALEDGGELVALAPNDKGGSRLALEIAAFGVNVMQTARRHHRICYARKGSDVEGLQPAIEAGALRFIDEIGFWSQPGIFAFDRIDPGTALLLDHLPPLSGRGADLGCGIGVIARHALQSAAVEGLWLVDIDRRAIDAARSNVEDPRASFAWADIRAGIRPPSPLDFVVMNPPFHDGGREDRTLGEAFIRRAAEWLAPRGRCYLTANRHLPYEAPLRQLFSAVTPLAEAGGYKVYEARK